jgi:hypothetical protein
MKKMIFSAVAFAVVAVSAVAVAPTTSEAIPAYARQTGAACLSCHFQSFPALTAFGRSFKQNAFTDMGEQALIEDDMLSIPAVLNATVVFRPQIQSVATQNAATVQTISYGDQVVLIGGRVGENVGTFLEMDTAGGAFANHQLISSFDVGGVKAGISYFNTGFSEDAGMALSNVWGQHGNLLGGRAMMANQSLWGDFRANAAGIAGNNGAGLTAHVITDMFTVQGGLLAPSDGVTFGGGAFGGTFTAAKMLRANGFFDVGGMTAMVGGIWVGGNVGDRTNMIAAGVAGAPQLEMARYGVEASLEGEMGHTSFGLYADYASAKKSSAAKLNAYNTSTLNARKGYGIRGTVKPLHNVILGLGYGSMKDGDAVLNDNRKDTIMSVGVEYEIYQNFVVAVTYTDVKNTVAGASTKTKTTLIDIEALL